MYSEMHIWRYNIKNYYIKHSQYWGVYRFQIDGQVFTSSYPCDGREQSSETNIFHSELNEIKITPNDTYPCDGKEHNLSINIFHSKRNEIKIMPNDTYTCDGRE